MKPDKHYIYWLVDTKNMNKLLFRHQAMKIITTMSIFGSLYFSNILLRVIASLSEENKDLRKEIDGMTQENKE